MTIAKRTADDEDRIVHGGELPEDDSSLDDVVVEEGSSTQKPNEDVWLYNHPVYQPHLHPSPEANEPQPSQPQPRQYKHQLPNGKLDRDALVDLFGITFESQTPKERDESKRIGVDKCLANLFGARYLHVGFAAWDFRWTKLTYTLNEVQEKLESAGVDFPARKFVREELFCWVRNIDERPNLCGDKYIFQKMIEPDGIGRKFRFEMKTFPYENS